MPQAFMSPRPSFQCRRNVRFDCLYPQHEKLNDPRPDCRGPAHGPRMAGEASAVRVITSRRPFQRSCNINLPHPCAASGRKGHCPSAGCFRIWSSGHNRKLDHRAIARDFRFRGLNGHHERGCRGPKLTHNGHPVDGGAWPNLLQ